MPHAHPVIRRALRASAAVAASLALPSVALGHTVEEKYEAPLPLVAYVAERRWPSPCRSSS